MTPSERRLIRQTFPLLQEYSVSLALLFYGRLFELDPGAKNLFHNDLALQSKKLLDMLASVVESLDNFQSLLPSLAELGRKHAGFGVRPEQYETLKIALLWTFAQALGPDFDDATRDAWRHALEAISRAMQAGVA